MIAAASWAAAMSVPALAADSVAVGTLKIVPTDSGYRITATVKGRAAADIDAKLTVMKQDASGGVQTRQSRRVQTSKGQNDQVAQTSVSMDDEGMLDVTLVLSEGDRMIYRASQRVARKIPD